MSILSRLTLRNIFGKSFRSFAIVIALTASAFAMLFCAAGRKAPEQELRMLILNIYGGSELEVIDTKGNLCVSPSDFPEGTRLLCFASASCTAITPNGEYAVKTVSFDTAKAMEMHLTEGDYGQTEGVIISEEFAQKSGLSVGDSMTLTRDSTSLTLKVTKISSDKYLRRNKMTVFTGLETIRALRGGTGSGYIYAYADVPDNLDVNKLSVELTEHFSEQNYAVMPNLTDSMLEDLNNQTMVFYLIFAVILLMTLFLTFSMSRHIANERLSVIGTLRSLGGSIAKTSRILLIESTVYGLIGGVIGSVLFMFFGKLAVSALFGFNGTNWNAPLLLYISAILMTVLIQLICQSGALIKAVRTPVRDIIFSSRDTAYILHIPRTVIGAALLAAGITAGLLTEDILISIAAVTLICVGAVMLLPLILRLLSAAFGRLFGALHLPCAKLTAKEVSHKKSTVAGTQLTFAALTITTAIFIVSSSIERIYKADIYHFDGGIPQNAGDYRTRNSAQFIWLLPHQRRQKTQYLRHRLRRIQNVFQYSRAWGRTGRK